jgi:alkylation response protein AidB-like acyl-CoA dehydrogenase
MAQGVDDGPGPLDAAGCPAERLSERRAGFRIALAALDGGRLGIPRSAHPSRAGRARHRDRLRQGAAQFGRAIIDFQGPELPAGRHGDAIEAARALYLAAARRATPGLPYGPQAAMAKLFCTDTAMR